MRSTDLTKYYDRLLAVLQDGPLSGSAAVEKAHVSHGDGLKAMHQLVGQGRLVTTGKGPLTKYYLAEHAPAMAEDERRGFNRSPFVQPPPPPRYPTKSEWERPREGFTAHFQSRAHEMGQTREGRSVRWID